MSSNDSKFATIQTRFQALTSVATSLNTATDELTKTVGVVDEALKRFNLGLVVWVIERKGDTVRIHDDATCIGWVEGFRDGFTVHDELLGIPQKDRMICMPREVTTVQIVREMKKRVDNPDKGHRATRFIASFSIGACVSVQSRKVVQSHRCGA
jgi:hypothetical protein